MSVDNIYTKALLHFNGNLIDESGKTWSYTGSVTFGSASPKFSQYGRFLRDATHTTVPKITTPQHSDFSFGTGDFTIDFWVKFNAHVYGDDQTFLLRIPGASGNDVVAIQPQTYGDNTADMFFSSGISYQGELIYFPGGLPLGVWTHFAYVRDGTSLKVFMGGVLQDTGVVQSDSRLCNGTVEIGKINDSGTMDIRNYYLDEFRISKGIARWTSDFTPPTRPYSPFLPRTSMVVGE